MKNSTTRPRLLLIGAGNFGREHLDTWQRIEAAGLVELVGVVVANVETSQRIAALYGIPIHVGFEDCLLQGVDAVDIASPPRTHFELVRRILPRVHVLVEKPLGISRREIHLMARGAAVSDRVLMVNHLYRFHPVLQVLEKLMKSASRRPILVSGTFLNPVEPGVENLSANLELLHYFDILDHLFQDKLRAVWSQRAGLVNEVSLQYASGMVAVLRLGWRGTRRVRSLELEYDDRKLTADFQDGVVGMAQRDRSEKLVVDSELRPLEASFRQFLRALAGEPVWYPDAEVGARVTEVALRAVPGPRRTRPTAIVIGGGVFGAACALEIAEHCDVVISERHSRLITEASWNNQLRHHSGFHYPRSPETVQEIRATRGVFDREYGDCIVRDVASYYCTAASAQVITGDLYLAFCKQHKLKYVPEAPPPGILDPNLVSLCLRTDELVLDPVKLRSMLHKRLAAHPSVELLLNTEVVSGRLNRGGAKAMRMKTGTKAFQESFDYLINASYANTNLISKWFGFPVRRIRFDLCELMELQIPIPKISVTILDAPFMSMMNTGEDCMFLAYQVSDGVLRSEVTREGLPPNWGTAYPSNHKVMLRHMSEFLPSLRGARYLGSRFGIRAVMAFHEDYDGRPTLVTRHGFGCWSVLGGKITACISSAREIVRDMFPGEVAYESDRPDDRPAGSTSPLLRPAFAARV